MLEALARAQFDAHRYGDAADSFRQIVEASPTDDYAQFGLGLALARTGNPRGAAEHLALAAAMRPDLRHYADALRGVRATLRARRERPAGPDQPRRARRRPGPETRLCPARQQLCPARQQLRRARQRQHWQRPRLRHRLWSRHQTQWRRQLRSRRQSRWRRQLGSWHESQWRR